MRQEFFSLSMKKIFANDFASLGLVWAGHVAVLVDGKDLVAGADAVGLLGRPLSCSCGPMLGPCSVAWPSDDVLDDWIWIHSRGVGEHGSFSLLVFRRAHRGLGGSQISMSREHVKNFFRFP